ncbi:MAG: hypothetical protein U0798_06000 [Gemmataceae bacterium]
MMTIIHKQLPVKSIQAPKKNRVPRGRVSAMLLELAYQLHVTKVVRMNPIVASESAGDLDHRRTE